MLQTSAQSVKGPLKSSCRLVFLPVLLHVECWSSDMGILSRAPAYIGHAARPALPLEVLQRQHGRAVPPLDLDRPAAASTWAGRPRPFTWRSLEEDAREVASLSSLSCPEGACSREKKRCRSQAPALAFPSRPAAPAPVLVPAGSELVGAWPPAPSSDMAPALCARILCRRLAACSPPGTVTVLAHILSCLARCAWGRRLLLPGQLPQDLVQELQ